MKMEKYKNYDIEVDSDGKFRAKDNEDNTVFISESMRGLKKQIDKQDKKEIRQKGFRRDRWEDKKLKEVIITSVCEEKGYYSKNYHLWTTTIKTKERRKMSLSEVYKDTPNNRELFKKISKLENEVEHKEKEVEKLNEQLERFTLKDLGYDKSVSIN